MSKRRRFLLVFLVLGSGFFAGAALAEGSATKAITAEEAVTTLRQASLFAIGGVGFAGTPSEGELALRSLLENPEAPVLLAGLLKAATPEGRLYALIGLKQVAPEQFEKAAKACRRQMFGNRVDRMVGCIGFEEPAIEVIDDLLDGTVKLAREGRETESGEPAEKPKPPLEKSFE